MGLLDPEQPKKKPRHDWMLSFNYRRTDRNGKKIYHDKHEKMTEEQRLRELNNLNLHDEEKDDDL